MAVQFFSAEVSSDVCLCRTFDMSIQPKPRQVLRVMPQPVLLLDRALAKAIFQQHH